MIVGPNIKGPKPSHKHHGVFVSLLSLNKDFLIFDCPFPIQFETFRQYCNESSIFQVYLNQKLKVSHIMFMKSIKLLKTGSSQKLKSHPIEFNEAPKWNVFQRQTLRHAMQILAPEDFPDRVF